MTGEPMPIHTLATVNGLEKLASGPYAAVFELLHTGISILSVEGNFLYANKAFLDMFNLSGEICGKYRRKLYTQRNKI